jgi:DNA-directed RNA polymerase specialized sigma24 family protein
MSSVLRTSADGEPIRRQLSDHTAVSNGDVRFPETSWSLLGRVTTSSSELNPATTEFADRYYVGVRAYISAILRDGPEAEELTQQFFMTVILSGRLLRGAKRAKGHFRPYLKQAIRNFLIDEHRRRARRSEQTSESAVHVDGFKRGWDTVSDERLESPDSALLRGWARSLVRIALARVKAISEEKGQQVHFQLFARRFLGDSDSPAGWNEIGAIYNLDEKAARSRAEIVVRRFRAVLWDLIATDIGTDSTFDEELRNLIAVL